MRYIVLIVVLIAEINARWFHPFYVPWTRSLREEVGVKLRLSERGLEYGSRIGQDFLKRLLDDIQNKTLQDTDKGYKLTNVSLGESDIESFKISLDPKNYLVRASVEGLSSRISLNYDINSSLPYTTSFEGSANILLKAADLNIAVSFDLDNDDLPTPQTEKCDVQIKDYQLDFDNYIHHFIWKLMKALWPETVRSWTVKMICDQVTNYIDKQIGKNMKLLKLSNEWDKFGIDYGFVSNLAILNHSIEARHKGEIFWSSEIKASSVKAGDLPGENMDDTDKMFNLWIGEYTVKTFAETAHTNSFLKARIAEDTVLTDKQRNLLRTTCSTTPCAGSYIPELSANADTSVQLEVSSNRAPEVQITEEGLRFHLHGDVIVSTKKDSQQQFKLKVILKLLSKAHVDQNQNQNRLIPEIITYELEIKELTSLNTQKFTEEQVYNFLHAVVRDIAVEEMQKIITEGLPLPSMPGVSLVDTDLRFTNGSVHLSTDVLYDYK